SLLTRLADQPAPGGVLSFAGRWIAARQLVLHASLAHRAHRRSGHSNSGHGQPAAVDYVDVLGRSARRRVLALSDVQRTGWIAWIIALGFLIAAVILNYSRAGVGLLVVGSALWLGIFSLRQRSPSKLAIIVSFLLLLGTALLVFGGQTLERFNLRNLNGPD